VIPVLNQARFLPAQLEAIARQSYSGEWELIVVDGGSTDGTLERAAEWSHPEVPVSVIRTRRGLNHQRQVGARAAAGDFVAFCDADDVASPDWIEALARAAQTADIVGGALEFERLNDPDVREWRDDEVSGDLEVHHDFLRAVPGGNCGVWTDVAHALGWDARFRFGSSDIEFSWRAQLGSFHVVYSPEVVMHVRHRCTLLGLAHQWYRYGESGGRLYRKFRHAGMPPSDRRQWLGEWRWLLAQAPSLARPGPHRAKWVRIAAFRLGRLVGGVRVGVVFP
jgi:glycosyltransferase involved in cell wall biosynthesis